MAVDRCLACGKDLPVAVLTIYWRQTDTLRGPFCGDECIARWSQMDTDHQVAAIWTDHAFYATDLFRRLRCGQIQREDPDAPQARLVFASLPAACEHVPKNYESEAIRVGRCASCKAETLMPVGWEPVGVQP